MTKTAQAIATADEVEVDLSPPPAPLRIDPKRVELNHSGQLYQSYAVRMPRAATTDDLKDPSIWEAVQTGPRGFRRWDHLLIIAWDESWAAEGIVADARSSGVSLIGLKVWSVPQRFEQLAATEEAVIKWDGDGWRVFRKADNVPQSRSVRSLALAERDLRDLYPAKL